MKKNTIITKTAFKTSISMNAKSSRNSAEKNEKNRKQFNLPSMCGSMSIMARQRPGSSPTKTENVLKYGSIPSVLMYSGRYIVTPQYPID